MIRQIAAFALACLVGASTAWAAQVEVIKTEGAVTALIETPRGAYIETERGTFRAEAGSCDGGICLTADVIRGLPKRAPEGALPDGKIATAAKGDISQAWYGRPTTRYAHGILGDQIEGGSLVVVTPSSEEIEFVLPDSQVFEDLTPRLVDLDGDGSTEIVTIRASSTGGAAVVVYGLENGTLIEKAASAENGRANRWLNIAEIIRLRDGGSRIVFVRTPHIGGIVTYLDFGDGYIRETANVTRNRTNHQIGSRVLDQSQTIWRDDQSHYVLLSQGRSTLHVSDGTKIALPAPVNKAIIAVGDILLTATDDGRLLAVTF